MRPLIALSLVLFATASAPDEIVLEHTEGLVLRKTFESSSESEIEHINENSSFNLTSTDATKLVVVDTVLALDGDRITKLERRYEEVEVVRVRSSEEDSGSDGGESEASSALEGETVVFEWDEDEEAYEVTSDADDELLADLRMDIGFAGFLPDGAVAVGEQWELQPDVYTMLIDFMHGVPLDSSGAGAADGNRHDDASASPPEVEEETDGQLTLTYAGAREVDGVTLALIEIDGEIEIERTMDHRRELEGDATASVHEQTVDTRTIEGTLLWNVDAGHLHSLELETDVEQQVSRENSIESGGREFASSGQSETTGTFTLEVTFERVED